MSVLQKRIGTPGYEPVKFFAWLKDTANCDNYTRLAEALGLDQSRVSEMRCGRREISASAIVLIHELTGVHCRELVKKMYRSS